MMAGNRDDKNLDMSEDLEENNNSKKRKKYCFNCGKELDPENKFCEFCGTPVKNKKESKKDNRKIYKCPNCGNPLKSFESTCPYCKTEIREIKVTDSISDFTKGLEKIQSRPIPEYRENPSLLKKMIGKDFNKSDAKEEFENEFEEKRKEDLISYIINYPIPNSKEDLLEFMILSVFNVDAKENDDDIQKAWITKMKQIIQKAKITIKSNEDLSKITELYDKKMDELNKRKIGNIIKVVLGIILYFAFFGFIVNPMWSIIVLLLVISGGLFIYSILFDKKIISLDFKLSKTLIHIICGVCVIIAFILFMVNLATNSGHPYKGNDDTSKDEEVEAGIDYNTAEEFEKALNDGKNVKGKIVKFVVKSYEPESILGINCWAGEHLNFISKEELDVKSGDVIIGKVTKEATKDLFGSWEISYSVLSIEKKDEEEEKKEDDKEQDISDNSDTKTIIMIVLPEEYVGEDAKSVEKEIRDLGYENVVLFEKETTDPKNKDGSIFEFTIAGKEYERGDRFNSTDEVKIGYWKYVGEKLDKIVLPKSDSKLGKDFDAEIKSEDTRYYLNIDGVKNIPKLVKYEKATITDGVYEYIEYLKSLGYQVEITDITNKEPYAGFHTYDTNFKVYSNDISWTMFLAIQDEKYIEYELDINLK